MPNPPRRGGDQLQEPRSTQIHHTTGNTTTQSLEKMNKPAPKPVPGHQNIDAAVPILGTGNNKSRAIAARRFDSAAGATGLVSVFESEEGMCAETHQKMH